MDVNTQMNNTFHSLILRQLNTLTIKSHSLVAYPQTDAHLVSLLAWGNAGF